MIELLPQFWIYLVTFCDLTSVIIVNSLFKHLLAEQYLNTNDSVMYDNVYQLWFTKFISIYCNTSLPKKSWWSEHLIFILCWGYVNLGWVCFSVHNCIVFESSITRCSLSVWSWMVEFVAVQELARRFSLLFGLDLVKSREAVATMHKLVY